MKTDTPQPAALPQSLSLTGRRALVTGSTRGIGRVLALAFAQAGASVAMHGRDGGLQAAAAARAASAACLVQSDLADADGPRRAYEQAVAGLGGAPDILVCNASLQIPADWLAVTRADFDKQVAVNWRATLELCQLAAPAMKAAGWGRILTVGSVQEAHPHPHMIVYAGTKCAQSSLATNLARQLAPCGVTVNNLAPGVILTDRNTVRLADSAYAAKVLASIPADYFGEPTDCAGAALLLCSDAGRYITGQTLFVDGGMSL
ncbi:SDR family oxidoreductase [Termitidicoccus mucosus]|uniref:Short-chain dehydrogenase n=1 Tax=Termitidicoccus mucosus TaxID=1184151 RepID=A0A178IQ42_9BACT|nr:short-chain dehydrogenase [Opitutaceae bacterium TSB47]